MNRASCILPLLVVSDAFSPVAVIPSSSAKRRNGRPGAMVYHESTTKRKDIMPLLNEDMVLEPNDDEMKALTDSIPMIESFPLAEFSNEDIVVNNVDVGEEIFMSAMDFSKPLEESMDNMTNDNLNFVLEAASQAAAAVDASFDPNVIEEDQVPTSSTIADAVMSDDHVVTEEDQIGVNAVLEASKDAAEAAEASLPQDLFEQLDFSSQSNDVTPTNILESSEPMILEEVPEILPASTVVGEPVTAPKIEAPAVSKILKFAIPAIGVWLCGPLLSLIDTSAVGVLSGTTQQAALNPAVAVTDYAALLIAFMYTGTTNLVAAAQQSDRSLEGKPETTKTMIGAMQLSTFVGAGLGAILFAFARPLLKAIIGNGSISPAVFTAAMKYVRIRALGMPAAAVIGSTQAACLGMQDIRSPLYVLAAAAVVNFLGDSFFVGCTHPLIGGAAGAAWATVFSQYAALAIFVRWLCNKPEQSMKPRVVNLSKPIMEITGTPASQGEDRRKGFLDSLASFGVPSRESNRFSKVSSVIKNIAGKVRPSKAAPKEAKKSSESVSVRGFLKDKFSFRDLIKPPTKEITNEFKPYLVPVTTTQVGRVSGYVAMSHVVASSLGTVSMAAQQVLVSLFYCLCPIADSLSLTAQSFLPAISERDASPEKTTALRKTIFNFFKAGGVFGAAMVASVCAIPLLSGYFTADAQVVALVNAVTPLLLAFFGVHGIMCSAEGLLLGQKDLSFLGKMYAGYFAAVPYLMLRVKRAALTGSHPVNLTSVWKVFVGYQLFRSVAWVGRVALLQRKTGMEGLRKEQEQQKLLELEQLPKFELAP